MKDLNKNITIGLAIAAILFVSVWLFNHVNAWIGIFTVIISAWVLLNYFIKQSKTNKNEKDKT